MGSFFSSLLGSYSDAMRQKHKQEQDKEEKKVDAQLEVLKLAVRDPSITQEAREAAFEQMEELTQGKGKKKSGFSFKNLIGKFSDTGQQQAKPQQSPATGGGPGGGQGGATATPAAPTGQGHTPAETPTAPPVPTRPQRFKTQQQMTQEGIDTQKQTFEQVTKPQLDYEHKLRLEEIEKQYGAKLTPRNNLQGSSVPPSITADTGGKPIDPAKKYSVLFNSQNQPVAAMEEYEKPASARASGPEAKVQSLAKDILADAKANGRNITPEQAETEARQLALRQARASLASTLESTRGKEFANKVRAALEKGVMTPATARAVIGYAGTEAKRRFADDMATISSGKSIAEIEEDIYTELGTSREEISSYLRQGAKSSDKPAARKFDSDLKPVPSRPN
jgi:hypothetical protein